MNPTIPSWTELRLVMPEIWLVLGMCAAILVPFVRRDSKALPALASITALLAALVSTLATIGAPSDSYASIFHNMLSVDPFSQFFKIILIVFTLFIILQWALLGRDRVHVHDTPDFLCLLLGAVFGMALMASAANLLMIFVATESASYPSYALAGFRKKRRLTSESSLKYVVFGSAASAVMLYGMSLIYGSAGSLDLATIAEKATTPGGMTPLFGVGILAMFAGFAFKLSAVPLHFWCPDVFEGAPIEVTTFLSVASKGAAVCLLLRVLSSMSGGGLMPGGNTGILTGLAVGVAIMGAVTATWGNLVALHQTNIKRLLAYSSIAHAGYMIMTASVLTVTQAGDPARKISSAILFYLFVYAFMNLGAFTVAALIARQTGSEDIRDYAGMSKRSPILAGLMTVFLMSLFGLPPMGGFMGKVFLMTAMVEAGPWGLALVAVLLINTLLSLYYYARPIWQMFFLSDDQNRPVVHLRGAVLAMLLCCTAALLWTGAYPRGVQKMTELHATMIQSSSSVAARSHLALENGAKAMQMGDLDLAEKYLEEAERIAPGRDMVWYNMALVQIMRGTPESLEKARQLLQKLQGKLADDPELNSMMQRVDAEIRNSAAINKPESLPIKLQ